LNWGDESEMRSLLDFCQQKITLYTTISLDLVANSIDIYEDEKLSDKEKLDKIVKEIKAYHNKSYYGSVDQLNNNL